MKEANFLFIVLIIAAAVITGSTVAIASNFDVLIAPLNTQPALTADNKSFDENTGIPNIDTLDTSIVQNTNQPISNVTFTPHEQEQVLEMLYALGMIDSSNYEGFIKDFQSKNSLNPTGELDAQTLTLIIQQVKIEKASNSVNVNEL